MSLGQTLRTCAGMLLLSIGASTFGASPSDYAFGLDLTPTDDQSGAFGFRTPLADVIYEQTTSANLKDVAVFNADGTLVPFVIHRIDTEVEVWEGLPLFTLDGKSVDAEGRVTVTTAVATVTVDGQSPIENSASANARPSFIIDTRSYRQPVRELKLAWAGATENLTVAVRIEASNDLNRWYSVGEGTLASLAGGDNKLLRDTLIIQRDNSDYLRITPIDMPPPGWEIITADVRSTEYITPNPRSRSLTPDSRGRFEMNGQFPIASMSLSVPYQTYAAEVTVYSRSAPKQEWNYRGTHVFAKTTSMAEPMRLHRVTDRYWKIESAQPLPNDYSVTVTWHPHELFFLAQGAPPYTLAFGSREAKIVAWSNSNFSRAAGAADITTFAVIRQAAAPRTLGGEELLRPTGIDPGAVAVWVILALGTLFVLLLARASRKSSSPEATASETTKT